MSDVRQHEAPFPLRCPGDPDTRRRHHRCLPESPLEPYRPGIQIDTIVGSRDPQGLTPPSGTVGDVIFPAAPPPPGGDTIDGDPAAEEHRTGRPRRTGDDV